MKISKRQLKRIIKEEKSKLLNEQRDIGSGLFNKNYIYDLFDAEFTDYLQTNSINRSQKLTDEELEMFRQAVNGAVRDLIRYYRK